MQTYRVIVDASNFYGGPIMMERKATDLNHLRKNLIKEFGDGSASVVKIKVYKGANPLGMLQMIVTSRNFQPTWIPADERIPARAISRTTGRRI